MSVVMNVVTCKDPSSHGQSSTGQSCVIESCRVVSCVRVAEETVSLTFESVDISRYAGPGQFVHVVCGSHVKAPAEAGGRGHSHIPSKRALLLRRPFSVCSSDPARGTVDILFRLVGGGTEWLSGRSPGDKIDVMGPLGVGFSLPQRPGAVVLAAGGIGVAPLVGWARALVDAGYQVHALVGARTRARLAGVAEIERAGAVTTACTDDGTRGFKGSVCELINPVIRKCSPVALYACGPSAVLRTAQEAARRLRLFCEVSVEDRLACGIGACMGCAVPKAVPSSDSAYFRACSDGPVFNANEICIQD
ncbi:MAG: dihydroorotate dehydrogenase electron transfer subunit [Firmicutes bacterium]|nr:dihydroorotate dehydrogenase electron transfer subunit [Bacillota bacterium]